MGFRKKISCFIWAKCHLKLIHATFIYVLKSQYAPNFPSHCPQSEVCNSALIFLVNIKTYFSQLFLKINITGHVKVNGTL